MPKQFSQPDAEPKAEKPVVQAQQEHKTTENMPTGHAGGVDAFDMADYIAQPREGASTGARKKLEANEFVDAELLGEAGYSDDGEYTATETVEAPAQTEISEEWLEIFAWAGVELTDEAMPRLLKYLHAEDDHTRFKLPPTRRDKLKIAWMAFLRKVLPAMDDKQGLLAVIIMLYIENIVVGIWKVFGRVMAGTFQWPKFWPFTMFSKKTEQPPQFTQQAPQRPQPQYSAAEMALMDEAYEPAPSAAKATQDQPQPQPAKMQVVKAAEPTPEQPAPKAEVVLAPVPPPIPGSKDLQDPIDGVPFAKEDGMPSIDWERTAPNQTTIYRVPAKTFRTQATFQKWLWNSGFYKERAKKNKK